MATLTRQTSDQAGITATAAAAAGGGDVVDNADGETMLLIRNDSGGSITVTVTCQDTTSYYDKALGKIAQANATKAVGAGACAIMGPFAPRVFNNSSGQLAITYSGVTTLYVTAFKGQK